MAQNVNPQAGPAAAFERTSLVDLTDVEDELRALSEAPAGGKGDSVASAGAAVFVKVMTGSSVAAGPQRSLPFGSERGSPTILTSGFKLP